MKSCLKIDFKNRFFRRWFEKKCKWTRHTQLARLFFNSWIGAHGKSTGRKLALTFVIRCLSNKLFNLLCNKFRDENAKSAAQHVSSKINDQLNMTNQMFKLLSHQSSRDYFNWSNLVRKLLIWIKSDKRRSQFSVFECICNQWDDFFSQVTLSDKC